jgi:hypothetical protein
MSNLIGAVLLLLVSAVVGSVPIGNAAEAAQKVPKTDAAKIANV